jgi:electron transfer flavoprotein alpha subunit
MPGTILAVAEVVDGTLTKLSTEVATLARELAEAAGGSALGLVVDAAPDAAATALSAYVPRVVAVADPSLAGAVPAPAVAAHVGAMLDEGVTHVILSATTDGRDVAGTLIASAGLGMLVNADAVTWTGDGPVVRSSVLGGKAIVDSALTGASGLVTLRPGAVTAVEAAAAGVVERRDPVAPAVAPAAVVDRVEEAGAQVSLEDARVVVVGGRGVNGPDGLGGVTGATRASVDAGWIPYARQIGQTGRIVKPALYLGLGVSGAMQHRVGMQASESIVAVNRDPDAPIAEIADLFVVGDLFEIGPALAAEIRSRRTG